MITEYQQRRQQVLATLDENSIAIIPTYHEIIRNGDTTFPFRPHSNFNYLTGFTEPDAIAVLIPNRAEGETILFNLERDLAMEIWNGRRAGQEGAVKDFHFDQAFPSQEFSKMLPELLKGKSHIYYAMGRDTTFDKLIMDSLNYLRSKVRSGVDTPYHLVNIENILHEMRLCKSPTEINTMRKAAQISANAHSRVMRMCRPGLYEYEIEAELLYEFFKHGSRFPAYSSIVATGGNACVLHYVNNTDQLKDGDLLLIDAGCELMGYASDITRTIPVNGKFTKEQQAIYEIVLNAQLACINTIRPGIVWNETQDLTIRLLTQGLIDLKIINATLDDAIQRELYKPFYMHRVSHWLGMDVHDVGAYKINDQWRKLESNMSLTVEPGLYISADTLGVDEKWWNIGIRIEDDIVVTDQGCEVLSQDVPKSIIEIETLMAAN